MPQRVLLMISSMRGGGSERQTLLLLRHLDRERFTPHLYVTERAGDLLSEVPNDVTIHSYADARINSGFYFPGRVLRQQVSYLRELVMRESIGVIYDRTFHMTMIAGPATESLNVPRVSTIVSPPHHALPLVESRFVWLKRHRLRKAYRQSRAIVAVSRQAAESAENYYGLKNNSVRVIKNPVDTEAVRKAAQAESCQRDDRPTVVCVARMTAEKGHADLIDALALTESRWPESTEPMKVWLIGDGPLRDELQSRCKAKLRIHDVEFFGALSNPAPLIAAADALILPSRFEGMPNVVLEAMALGTPVIATQAGGTIELQNDEPTAIWAEPNNPASLADAILEFVSNRDAAKRYAVAATSLIESQHDVRATTREIEKLLDP